VKCESAAVAIGPHKVEPGGLIVIVRKRTKTNGCYRRSAADGSILGGKPAFGQAFRFLDARY